MNKKTILSGRFFALIILLLGVFVFFQFKLIRGDGGRIKNEVNEKKSSFYEQYSRIFGSSGNTYQSTIFPNNGISIRGGGQWGEGQLSTATTTACSLMSHPTATSTLNNLVVNVTTNATTTNRILWIATSTRAARFATTTEVYQEAVSGNAKRSFSLIGTTSPKFTFGPDTALVVSFQGGTPSATVNPTDLVVECGAIWNVPIFN